MPEALVVLARRRLEFALGRFGPRVRSLAIRLKDVNGPKGDVDAAVAIDRAVDRAGRAVARAVFRRAHRRPLARHPADGGSAAQ